MTVRVERVLPGVHRYASSAPTPGSYQLHLYTDIDRATRTGNFLRIDVSMFTRGRRLLVAYRNPTTYVDWPFSVVPTDTSGERLAARWHQFPVGTPVLQVLEPAEWNNPARGCPDGLAPVVDGGRP